MKLMNSRIMAKQDYSSLFSSLGSSAAAVSGSTFLSDYASIKNGSYGKLMKAYYSKSPNDSVSKLANKSVSKSKDDTKTLANVDSTTDALKASADKLLVSGSKSLFKEVDITTKDKNDVETTTKGYDMDAIYNAVSTFVKDYNAVMGTSKDINSTTLSGKLNNLAGTAKANSKILAKIGITVNGDSTLSLDKDTFLGANTSTIKDLFNGNHSFSYRVSAQASLINFAAQNEASKSNTYNYAGGYSNNYSSGNMFNSYF